MGLLSMLMLGVLPMAATPESEGVSSAGLVRWLDACERENAGVHGFVLLRHGKTIAEGTWAPYDTLRERHRLYSHSKSFTSTAIGFLVDDGKLDLDERVCDIFPDKLPPSPSENLRSLRVRDLLTMNVGAARTDSERDDADGDWERAFLANRIDGRPGTGFRYDSGATYMLSAIVGRRSGKPMMEFLRERLFDPLGYGEVWSTLSPSGTPCGGWGMNMTTRELARFGQLFLDRGVWQGKRLLSEQWIVMATARQTWSGPIGITGDSGSDWDQGYGFQFWRCRHNCYRADGAGGQFTIVMPEHDAVLSLHSGSDNSQRELGLVWRYVLPAMSAKALPEDAAALARLRRRCAELAIPPVAGGGDRGAGAFAGIDFQMTNSACTITGCRLDRDGKGWTLALTTASGVNRFPVGFGRWERGEATFSDRRHESLGAIVGVQRVAASAATADDGRLDVTVMLLDGPQKIELGFVRDAAGNPSVSGLMHGICGGRLAGCRSGLPGGAEALTAVRRHRGRRREPVRIPVERGMRF